MEIKEFVFLKAEGPYIYESPDGGKTIYRRNFMEHPEPSSRELVLSKEEEKQKRIFEATGKLATNRAKWELEARRWSEENSKFFETREAGV